MKILAVFALISLFVPHVTATDEPPLSYSGIKCRNLGRKCNECEGDCERDSDCGEGLVCYKRGHHAHHGPRARVPGCSTNPPEWYRKNFCVVASDSNVFDEDHHVPPLTFSGQCRTLGRKCNLCEGDCEKDEHCADGLGCFIRNSGTFSESMPVPGCSTNPRSLFAKDFCVDLSKYPCKDQETFTTNYGYERDCAWITSDKDRQHRRCELYGHFCRETCGYCRTRTNS